MPTPKAKKPAPTRRRMRRVGGQGHGGDGLAQPAAQPQEAQAQLAQQVRDLIEARDQQKATAEILGVISRSPTDVRPVFDMIAKSAVQLCNGHHASVFQFDGQLIHFVAHYNLWPQGVEATRKDYPIAPGRGTASGRAILERAVVQIPDAFADPEYAHGHLAQFIGCRSIVAVPIVRQGTPVGVIVVPRPEAGFFPETQIALLKTFADQAAIAIENVRLVTELLEKNRALTDAHAQVTEALEQQTATSEILRVISASPTDVRPVFNMIAKSAVQLCNGHYAGVFQFDGELIHFVTHYNLPPEGVEAIRKLYPIAPGRGSASGRAILSRAVVQIPDVSADPEYTHGQLTQIMGHRGVIGVPILREGEPIGVIVVPRAEPGVFPEKHIELLQTFADQAAIAIENVRLLQELHTRNRELTDALDQQTATSEILRVISASPADVRPVFDMIAKSAVQLCNGRSGAVYQFDGDLIHFVAHYNYPPGGVEAVRELYPMPPDASGVTGRAILHRAVVEIPDVDADPEYTHHRLAHLLQYRSIVGVPMLRDGQPIGAIVVPRAEAGRFPAKHIELLKTFADQAVIAIENVHLFTELQARNRDLTEALDQQTSTSEVLKVISRSTFDLQPVLDTLIENATRLCSAKRGGIYRFDGEVLRGVADYGTSPEFREYWQRVELRPGRGSGTGRAAIERRTVHMPDVLADPEFEMVEAQKVAGVRTLLCVPMLREGALLGVITLWRTEVRPFTDKQIELVTTFADQAVIAIENVRLLQELQAKTDALTRSVDELTALGQTTHAVNSSLELGQVLTTIAEQATTLCQADAGFIHEYREETGEFRFSATWNARPEYVRAIEHAQLTLGKGATGQSAATGKPVQIPDILVEPDYPFRDLLARENYRAVLSVPMLHDGRTLGTVSLVRKTPGVFSDEHVRLLTTFANQTTLAIEHARLYRDLVEKGRMLEEASRHKSEFLANMSHELRTPLNAILGFSEVLLERMFGELNAKQAEFVQDVLSSGQHLLSLINDILDLSKVEAGRMELHLAPFNLPLAIESAVSLVRERASRHGISLSLSVDDALGEVVADERKVRQIFLNLLSNAVKFTPDGGRVEVKAALAGDWADIAVRDTGIGIAPEDQAAVFEEFRQVGGPHAQTREGTGLGLALAKRFAELHGGTIGVQSAVGQGSTFTVTLPVRPCPTR